MKYLVIVDADKDLSGKNRLSFAEVDVPEGTVVKPLGWMMTDGMHAKIIGGLLDEAAGKARVPEAAAAAAAPQRPGRMPITGGSATRE